MFSKVANRVRRGSIERDLPTPSPSPTEQQQVIQVDIAPALLRWSDFSTPFPSVSVGGYSRFYTTHSKIPESVEPFHIPLLSQHPAPSPSSEIPLKSLLFNTPKPRCLHTIREVSLESLTIHKPKNLTINTNTSPPIRSLKRRRRRLLRTPSIERDFILVGGKWQSPSDTRSIDTSEVSTDASSADVAPSPCSAFSEDSQLSHDEPFDSNRSGSPITPSTSISGENDGEWFSTEVLERLASYCNESDAMNDKTD